MAERDISGELDELRSDLQKLRSDMKEILESLKEEAGDRAEDAAARIRDKLSSGMDYVKDGLGDAQEYSEKLCKNVKKTIEERPMTSVLVALGVGLLIGRLVKRR